MARACYICGRGPKVGHNVSRAKNRVKRRFLPNLQQVRILEDGEAKRVRVCSRCIKAGKVRKAP